MKHDEDPLDLLEDDGDGVNDMCLFFGEDSKKENPKGPLQRTGCGAALFLMGGSVISTGFLLGKILA